MKAAELPGLNILRVLASLYMVMYHLHPAFLPQPVQNFFSNGSSATSLFFILSGFLLTHLYLHQSMDHKNQLRFVYRRLARIIPANFIGLLFLIGIHQTLGHHISNWPTLIRCLLLVQAWTVGESYAMNVPAWSMSCLVFFYLIFPVLLPQIKRVGISKLQTILLLTWLVSTFGIQFLIQYPGAFDSAQWVQYLHNSPLPRSGEFILGIGTAALIHKKGLLPAWLPNSVVGLVLVSMLFLPNYGMPVDNGLFAPIIIMIVLAFTRPTPFLKHIGNLKVVKLMSSASICVYLLHMTFIQYFNYIVLPYWHLEWNAGLMVLFLANLVGAAVIVDHVLCRPATRWLVHPTFPAITIPVLRFRRPLPRSTEQAQSATA
jgi:peptidoglycan/LPS O-acetylase OafA/YrhL